MNAVANTESVSTSDSTPESTGAEDLPPELSKDELFHLLQNQRRRRVLLYLQGTDSKVNMRDVAEQVAAWENDTTVEALSSDERQRVYIALYQSHLPKLDDADVLSYNQQRGIVERTPLANQLDTYLNVDTPSPLSDDETGNVNESSATDVAPEGTTDDTNDTDAESGVSVRILSDSSIIRYYGGATLASALLTAVSWTGLVAVPGLVLATFITGLFIAVTIGMTISQHDHESPIR
jgi:hypothetical protein